MKVKRRERGTKHNVGALIFGIFVIIFAIFIIPQMMKEQLPEFKKDYNVLCDEGKYAPTKTLITSTQETVGVKPDFVRVERSGDFCVSTIILKKTITLLGTDTKTLPGIRCNMWCVNSYEDKSNIDFIMNSCCE